MAALDKADCHHRAGHPFPDRPVLPAEYDHTAAFVLAAGFLPEAAGPFAAEKIQPVL